MATIWSPSTTFKIFGKEVTISAEVGSIGGKVILGKGAPKKIGASYGIGFSVSW